MANASVKTQTVVSQAEKKRARLNLGKREVEVLKTPYLLATQLDSYNKFLQADVSPEKRTEMGLHGAFKSVFPITSYYGHTQLEYVEYTLGKSLFEVDECKLRGATYA